MGAGAGDDAPPGKPLAPVPLRVTRSLVLAEGLAGVPLPLVVANSRYGRGGVLAEDAVRQGGKRLVAAAVAEDDTSVPP